MRKRLLLCLIPTLLFGWTGIGVAQQSKPAQLSSIPAEVWQKARAQGVVRIIVWLNVMTREEAELRQVEVRAQRQAIAAAQHELVASLAGTKHKVIERSKTVPFVGLDVGMDALAVLEHSPLVIRVEESRLGYPQRQIPMEAWHFGSQNKKIPVEVWQKAHTEGVARVFVQLDAAWEVGALSPEAELAQQRGIAAAQDALLADLAGTRHRVLARFRVIPSIGLEVGLDALAVLARSLLVIRVDLEGPPAKPAG